jgi:integrase
MEVRKEKIKKGWHANGNGECPFKNRSCRVEPLRKTKHINAIKRLLVNNPRNFALFVVGINSGLRASDLLVLKWRDVSDDENEIKSRIKIKEIKTGKLKEMALTSNSQAALKTLLDKCKPEMDDYIFPSKKGGKMSIQRMHQLVYKWTSAIGLKENYGTHTLRKTFAYFLLKKGCDIMILMDLLNHSSPAVTLRYAGITQEDRDKTILRLNL